MGRYLDILRRAEAVPCDKSDESDKRPPFGRLCRFGRTLHVLEQRCPAYIEPADWRKVLCRDVRGNAIWPLGMLVDADDKAV